MSENKTYTLRRLNGEDFFPVMEIIGKVLPDDLAPLFMDLVTGGKDIEEIGGTVMFRLVATVVKDIRKVEDDVFAFLTDVSGLSRDEIKDLGLLAVPKMIWEIYNAEKDFFGQ